jgi:hypothetical protein
VSKHSEQDPVYLYLTLSLHRPESSAVGWASGGSWVRCRRLHWLGAACCPWRLLVRSVPHSIRKCAACWPQAAPEHRKKFRSVHSSSMSKCKSSQLYSTSCILSLSTSLLLLSKATKMIELHPATSASRHKQKLSRVTFTRSAYFDNSLTPTHS